MINKSTLGMSIFLKSPCKLKYTEELKQREHQLFALKDILTRFQCHLDTIKTKKRFTWQKIDVQMFIAFIKVFLCYFYDVVLVIQVNFHVRVLSLQFVRQDTRSSCYNARTHQDKVNIKYQICSDYQLLAITFL